MATSPRSGELIILCWAIGTTGLVIIVRYQNRPGVWLRRCAWIDQTFEPAWQSRRLRPTLLSRHISRCPTTTIPHRRGGVCLVWRLRRVGCAGLGGNIHGSVWLSWGLPGNAGLTRRWH